MKPSHLIPDPFSNLATLCRNIVYLIAEYLKEAGLHKTHSTLIDESQLSNEFAVCDNVDLETIYLEFCSYFQVKFGKKPRFVKKLDQLVAKTPSLTSIETRQNLAKKRASLKTGSHATSAAAAFPVIADKLFEASQCLRVSSISPPTQDNNSDAFTSGKISPIYARPMTNEDFLVNHPCDWKDMTEIIFKDVVKKDLCVKWDEVVGQTDAKQAIQESVILPMKFPQLFNGVEPWKGQWSC